MKYTRVRVFFVTVFILVACGGQPETRPPVVGVTPPDASTKRPIGDYEWELREYRSVDEYREVMNGLFSIAIFNRTDHDRYGGGWVVCEDVCPAKAQGALIADFQKVDKDSWFLLLDLYEPMIDMDNPLWRNKFVELRATAATSSVTVPRKFNGAAGFPSCNASDSWCRGSLWMVINKVSDKATYRAP